MGKSSIEWTGSTWNPLRARNLETEQIGTWCQKISPGCGNCYAHAHNARNLPHGSSGLPYSAQGGAKAELFIDPVMLAEPINRRKPETWFPCSLTDLFLERYSNEDIAAVFGVMAMTRRHTYQVLSKRLDRAREWFRWMEDGPGDKLGEALGPIFGDDADVWVANYVNGWSRPKGLPDDGNPCNGTVPRWPLANVWLGASVELQEFADSRIPDLLATPALLRFLSVEPLLAPLDISQWFPVRGNGERFAAVDGEAVIGYFETAPDAACAAKAAGAPSIDWVIVGGESGRGARVFDVAWAESLIRQCREAGVPCFMKQMGSHPVYECMETSRDHQKREHVRWKLRDSKGGDWNEWPESLRVRQMPEVHHV